jgi:hypothetical protein
MAEAYQSIRRFDERTLRLVEPPRALRILRYAAWIAQRYADPAFQRAFADFDEIQYWQRELASLTEQLEHVRAALGSLRIVRARGAVAGRRSIDGDVNGVTMDWPGSRRKRIGRR